MTFLLVRSVSHAKGRGVGRAGGIGGVGGLLMRNVGGRVRQDILFSSVFDIVLCYF